MVVGGTCTYNPDRLNGQANPVQFWTKQVDISLLLHSNSGPSLASVTSGWSAGLKLKAGFLWAYSCFSIGRILWGTFQPARLLSGHAARHVGFGT